MRQPVPAPVRAVPLSEAKPGLSEMGVLLNQFLEPAFLVNSDTGTILLTNSELLKLTAFSRTELEQESVSVLLADDCLQELVPGKTSVMTVRRRNREAVLMQVYPMILDAAGSYYFVRLSEAPEKAEVSAKTNDELALDVLKIASFIEGSDFSDVVSQIAEVTCKILQMESVAVYVNDADYPQLRRIAQSTGKFQFPQTVSSTDLIQLALPTDWVPGKRVIADLHRFSRKNNLGYVFSVPFGKGRKQSGLIVTGTQNYVPDSDISGILEIVSQVIDNLFHNQQLNQVLDEEKNQQIKLISLNEALLNNSKEGILILDKFFDVVTMNIAAEEMLGYANSEVMGRPVDTVIIGPSTLSQALAAASKGIPSHELGNELTHRRNGQTFPANLQVIPIIQNGQVEGILIFLVDISEHAQIQLRTQQLEQRAFLGELMQVFAHEVRNPINNISLGLQLLVGLHNDNKTSVQIIHNAQTDCTRLIHLMESILSFSKQVESKSESIDITLLLQRLMDRWRPRMMNVNVEAFFQAEPDLPNVRGDRRSLEQVFVNLFTNSVEAMSETGGTLAIKVGRCVKMTPPSQIEISISDTGPGISDDMRARLFEPFATTKLKGTGLGLAITKQIINAHQGSIQVSSFPGGTVFHVYLPVANNSGSNQ